MQQFQIRDGQYTLDLIGIELSGFLLRGPLAIIDPNISFNERCIDKAEGKVDKYKGAQDIDDLKELWRDVSSAIGHQG